MEVIGADGVHVGTVDRVTGDSIRLMAADSGQGRHKGHHHYIQLSLVADVEGDTVRLSANAVTFEEEASGDPTQVNRHPIGALQMRPQTTINLDALRRA